MSAAIMPFRSAALEVMKAAAQAVERRAADKQNGGAVVVTADGRAQRIEGADSKGPAVSSRVSGSLFEPGQPPSQNELRLKLFEQLGVEVGLKMSNYADLKDYAADLRTAIAPFCVKRKVARAR